MKVNFGRNTFDITNKDRVLFNGACYILITQKVYRGYGEDNPTIPKYKAKKFVKSNILVECNEKYKGFLNVEYPLYRFDIEQLKKLAKED